MRYSVLVTAAMVDAETGRRIEARYKLHTQINALNGADTVDWDWIASVRAAGKTLKSMTPIPPDFAADHRWPSPTGASSGSTSKED